MHKYQARVSELESQAKEQFSKYNNVKKAYHLLKKGAEKQSQVDQETDSKLIKAQEKFESLKHELEEQVSSTNEKLKLMKKRYEKTS